MNEYAGHFEHILFSILPDEKLESKKGAFEAFKVYFPENGFTKVWRPKDCEHGVTCKLINDFDHQIEYYHPEKCPNLFKCKDTSSHHRGEYWHVFQSINKACPDGGECVLGYNSASHRADFVHPVMCKFEGNCKYYHEDRNHRKEFFHPPLCQYKGDCSEDYSPDHTRKYIHPAYCRNGKDCTDDSQLHIQKFRHPKRECMFKLLCRMDCNWEALRSHLKFFSHPFFPPCNYFTNCTKAKEKDLEHMNKYSHLCKWGVECDEYKNFGKKGIFKEEDHLRVKNFVLIYFLFIFKILQPK